MGSSTEVVKSSIRGIVLAGALAAGMAAAAAPAHAAARSVTVHLHNRTSMALTLQGSHLGDGYGQWVTSPPSNIPAGADGNFKSESSKALKGCGGWATYAASNGKTVHVEWDNPYIGGNSYHFSTSQGLVVSESGGKGNDSSVDWTVTEGQGPTSGGGKTGILNDIQQTGQQGVNAIQQTAQQIADQGQNFLQTAKDKGQQTFDTLGNGAQQGGNFLIGNAQQFLQNAKDFAEAGQAAAKLAEYYAEREKNATADEKAMLANMRSTIQQRGYKFTVALTQAGDYPLRSIAGYRHSNRVSATGAPTMLVSESESLPFRGSCGFFSKPSASDKSFDWRSRLDVSRVRDQGSAGTCWDFAACGALECSYMIKYSNAALISPQQVLTCSGAGSAEDGGDYFKAFQWMKDHGVANDVLVPYHTADQWDKKNDYNKVYSPYAVDSFGYVSGSADVKPSVAQIKQALCDHGPLATTINATTLFQHYSGGVFNEKASGDVNHAIMIVGWDDDRHAWLIKNSWSILWGSTCGFWPSGGYAWVDYDTNNIGKQTCWVEARKYNIAGN